MRRAFTVPAVLAGGLLTLAACGKGMQNQPRYDPYGEAELFADGKVMQAPPPGTIGRDHPEWTRPYRERPPLTDALLQRGQARYAIYCSPCHGYAGYGDGMVVSRGFPAPPSFHSARLRSVPSRHFFDVITRGYGAMYSYAARVPPADRWAIAAYIRALQISQGAKAGDLPAEDRDAIDRASRGAGAELSRDRAG